MRPMAALRGETGSLGAWLSRLTSSDCVEAPPSPTWRASSGAGEALTTKDFVALNLVWKEIEVEPHDIVVAKVTHDRKVGAFALGNKHIRAGVTNVNTSNPVPRLSFSADASGVMATCAYGYCRSASMGVDQEKNTFSMMTTAWKSTMPSSDSITSAPKAAGVLKNAVAAMIW